MKNWEFGKIKGNEIAIDDRLSDMMGIVEGGYVYAAQPPLFRVKQGKQVWYTYSDAEQEKLLQAAGKLSCQPLQANVATGDQFVASLEKKYQLAQQFGAACCDMEGGAVAQVCYEMQVPFGEYRGISDETHDTGREYLLNMQDAAQNSARLICEFVKDWEM